MLIKTNAADRKGDEPATLGRSSKPTPLPHAARQGVLPGIVMHQVGRSNQEPRKV